MSEFSVESILFKDVKDSGISSYKINTTKSMDELAYEMAKSEEDLKFFETYSMINDYNTNQKLRMLKRLNNITNRIKNRNISNSCESYINSIVYSLEDDNPTSTSDQPAGETKAEGGEASGGEVKPEQAEKKKNIFIRFFSAIGRAIKAAAMFVVRQIKRFLHWISRGKWFKDWDDRKKKDENSANLKGNAPEGGSDNGGGEGESGSTSEAPKSEAPAPEKKEEPKQQAPEKDKFAEMKDELSKILAEFGLSDVGYLNFSRGSKFTAQKFISISKAVNKYKEFVEQKIKAFNNPTNESIDLKEYKSLTGMKKSTSTEKVLNRFFDKAEVEKIGKIVSNENGDAKSLVEYVKIFSDNPMFVKLPGTITRTTLVDIVNTFNKDALDMLNECLSQAATITEDSHKLMYGLTEKIVQLLKNGNIEQKSKKQFSVIDELKEVTDGLSKISRKCDAGSVKVVSYAGKMMGFINKYASLAAK